VRKKILHIITRLDMGGSAQNTLLTCQELCSEHEIVLVHGLSYESRMTELEKKMVTEGIEKAKKLGVRVIPLPSMVRRVNPIRDLMALFSLIGIIIAEKPHIVHTHSSKAGIIGRLAAKFAGVPYIVHTPHGHVFYGHFSPLASKIFLWLEKLFSKFTDRMIALTEGERDDYLNFSVCNPTKLLTIHSGVNVEKFMQPNGNAIQKRRSLGLNQKGPIIGFVGWLLPIKGPGHLLKAMEYVWSEHPETSVVFVGKGDLDVKLRAETLRMNANGRVKFLGWREDVDEIMPIFDMLVLPSLNEGMGRVLVEAMAAGKPVVASRVGGIPDLVQHCKTGFLVSPADEKALADSIKKLLSDPEKAFSMGIQGRKYCQQFSLEAMITKLDDLYSNLTTN
jgi:glycosyltransferase involved in cell wall biosynthesis